MRFRHLLFFLAACGSQPSGVSGDDDPGHDGGSSSDGGGGGDGGDSDGGTGDGGTSGDGGTTDGGTTGDGGTTDGGTTDGGTTGNTSQICDAHAWNVAVPASGTSIMAYGSKAYLFAANGLSWTVVEDGAATISAIPFPAGITAMQSVTVEIAPSGRPFVTFTDAGQRWGTFFNGTSFVGTTALGQAQSAHADASERIYANTPNGLTEFAPGQSPLIRGAFPYTANKGWTVAPDGTVYLLRAITRPSTIHPGDTANELRVIRLRHATLTWGDEVAIGSNEGYGFSQVAFAAAPDGSLHVAYTPIGIYFRSQNGQTWVSEQLISFNTTATMIDPANPGIDGEAVNRVKGGVFMVAAQDYDHATVTLVYNGGSFSVPSYYFLRRCPPFNPTFPAWPAERLAMSGAAFGPTPVAVNERGVPAIYTPFGVRQDEAQ